MDSRDGSARQRNSAAFRETDNRLLGVGGMHVSRGYHISRDLYDTSYPSMTPLRMRRGCVSVFVARPLGFFADERARPQAEG